MKTLQQIFEDDKMQKEIYELTRETTPYARTMKRIKAKRERIEKLEKELEALEKRAEKQEQKHYKALDSVSCWWGKTILTPIANEILEKHADIFADFEILGSFGLDHETSIWFYADKKEKHDIEEIKASVTFYYRKEIEIATGEKSGEYQPGSIGDLNGFNNIGETIVSIEQIDNYVMKSYNEHEKEQNK